MRTELWKRLFIQFDNHTCVSELEYERYLKYRAFYGLGVQLPPQVPLQFNMAGSSSS